MFTIHMKKVIMQKKTFYVQWYKTTSIHSVFIAVMTLDT